MSNDIRRAAECFPPGDFLGEEMAERGLDVEWLCGVLRCDDYGALALLKGERPLNALEAGRLGRALGTYLIDVATKAEALLVALTDEDGSTAAAEHVIFAQDALRAALEGQG